jgi:hypothetical protein
MGPPQDPALGEGHTIMAFPEVETLDPHDRVTLSGSCRPGGTGGVHHLFARRQPVAHGSGPTIRHPGSVTIDLDDYRIVTASAYAGMMMPLTRLPSTVSVLTGDTDNDGRFARVESLSLEALDGVRRRWRLGDLARLAEFVPKLLSRSWYDGRPAIVVPPRATPAWAEAAAAWPDDVRLVGHADVGRIADDKIFVREQLRLLDVPVPASVVVPAPEALAAYPGLVERLGSPFVLQAPQGAGGQGTSLVGTAAELAAAVRAEPHVPQWLASAYAGDTTINVAGVVYPDRVVVSPASVQASGIAELGAAYGAYCGSDFGAVRAIAPALLERAYEGAARIGAWLHRGGHRGIYGADIAVSDVDIAFLEVNPRIQGSSWLLSAAQGEAGLAPCLVEHVRALLDDEPGDDGPVPVERAVRPFSGSHLLLRWTGPQRVVESGPRSGEYLAGPEQVTVTGLPGPGTVLVPGAITARLHASGSLVTPGGSLGPGVRELITYLAGEC